MIWPVRDISGTRIMTPLPSSRAFFAALIYISVLPLPVTPWIRKRSFFLPSMASSICLTASSCSEVNSSTGSANPRSPASESCFSRRTAALPAGVKHLMASMYLHRYLPLIQRALRTISSVSETSPSILSTARSLPSTASSMPEASSLTETT